MLLIAAHHCFIMTTTVPACPDAVQMPGSEDMYKYAQTGAKNRPTLPSRLNTKDVRLMMMLD